MFYRWWVEGYLEGSCVKKSFGAGQFRIDIHMSPVPLVWEQDSDCRDLVWEKAVVDAPPNAPTTIPDTVIKEFAQLEACTDGLTTPLLEEPRTTRPQRETTAGISRETLLDWGYEVAELPVDDGSGKVPVAVGAQARPILRALAHASLLGIDTLDGATSNATHLAIGCRMRLLAKASELVLDAHMSFEAKGFLAEALSKADNYELDVLRETFLAMEDQFSQHVGQVPQDAGTWMESLNDKACQMDQAIEAAIAKAKSSFGKPSTIMTMAKMVSWVARRPVHIWESCDSPEPQASEVVAHP